MPVNFEMTLLLTRHATLLDLRSSATFLHTTLTMQHESLSMCQQTHHVSCIIVFKGNHVAVFVVAPGPDSQQVIVTLTSRLQQPWPLLGAAWNVFASWSQQHTSLILWKASKPAWFNQTWTEWFRQTKLRNSSWGVILIKLQNTPIWLISIESVENFKAIINTLKIFL